jgi:hypothetical protein
MKFCGTRVKSLYLVALYVLHYDDRVLDPNSRDGPGQQLVFFLSLPFGGEMGWVSV